jgi:hypothetical protein
LYVRSIAEQYAQELASGFEIKHNPELRNLRVGENLSLFMSSNLHDLNEADFECKLIHIIYIIYIRFFEFFLILKYEKRLCRKKCGRLV